MKKAEKYIYLVLGIILIVVIACSIIYVVKTNSNKTEIKEENSNSNEEKPILKDGVTLKNTYQEGNDIIQEYEVILNGIKNNFKINYTYSNCYDISYCINGKYNDYNLYYGEFYNMNIDNLFTAQTIEQKFNESNFKIIKGNDKKDYLLIYAFDSLYIFDENLEIVKYGIDSNWYEGDNKNAFIMASTTNIPVLDNYYDDALNICDNWDSDICSIYVKVENNQIYYLTPNISYNDYINNYDFGTPIEVEERVYTINNGKLTYEIINTYKTSKILNMV